MAAAAGADGPPKDVKKVGEKLMKHIGLRVFTAAHGMGKLLYYGDGGLGGGAMCGIAFEKRVEGGGDGSPHFSAPAGCGLLVDATKVELVAEAKKKGVAKKKAPPKKKFVEEVPSLRKKIDRSGGSRAGTPSTPTGGARPGATRTPMSTGGKKKATTSKGAAGASRLKQDHLKKERTGLVAGLEGLSAERRTVTRAARPPSESSGTDASVPSTPVPPGEATAGATDAEDALPSLVEPEDWIEAKKRIEREKADEIQKEKEAADEAAHEARRIAAEKRAAEEEARLDAIALEAAAKRDLERAERKAAMEKGKADRAARREALEKQAFSENEALSTAIDAAENDFASVERDVEAKRAAQKDRIAAMMARMKGAAQFAQEAN